MSHEASPLPTPAEMPAEFTHAFNPEARQADREMAAYLAGRPEASSDVRVVQDAEGNRVLDRPEPTEYPAPAGDLDFVPEPIVGSGEDYIDDLATQSFSSLAEGIATSATTGTETVTRMNKKGTKTHEHDVTVKPDTTRHDDLLDAFATKLARSGASDSLAIDALTDFGEKFNLSDEDLDAIVERMITVKEHDDIRKEIAAAEAPDEPDAPEVPEEAEGGSEEAPVDELPAAPVVESPRRLRFGRNRRAKPVEEVVVSDEPHAEPSAEESPEPVEVEAEPAIVEDLSHESAAESSSADSAEKPVEKEEPAPAPAPAEDEIVSPEAQYEESVRELEAGFEAAWANSPEEAKAFTGSKQFEQLLNGVGRAIISLTNDPAERLKLQLELKEKIEQFKIGKFEEREEDAILEQRASKWGRFISRLARR